MKNVKILPYKASSKGAAVLSEALDCGRLRLNGSTLKGRRSIKIINWGSSQLTNPEFAKCTVINSPEDVRDHSNKLSFFKKYRDFDFVVPWTEERETVRQWLVEGDTVIARTILNGHSGAGIVVMKPDAPETWVEAPLYTKYRKKKSEFRVHFMNKEIIDVQKKALKEGVQEPNWMIRNHDNGFIFAREFGELPGVVSEVSQAFVGATSLYFGAIDIIYNERNNSAHILEVNTAPGLVGTTVEKYKEAFMRNLGND